MFDVDKLKEAVKTYDRSSGGRGQNVFVDAARMVVAGQPLWWCEEHKAEMSRLPDLGYFGDRGLCWRSELGELLPQRARLCRMVEGWWMPTGGGDKDDENLAEFNASRRMPTGKDET